MTLVYAQYQDSVVVSVSKEPTRETVPLDDTHADIVVFNNEVSAHQKVGNLRKTDAAMIPVVEEIWDLLKAKGIVVDGDLTKETQDTLALRSSIRDTM